MWSIAFRPTGLEGPRAVAVGVERQITRSEDAAIAVAVDEAVRRVAVGADRGVFVDAVLVFQQRRPDDADGAAARGRVVGRGHVVHFQGDVLHAVAVLDQPLRFGMLGPSGEASTKVMLPWRST